MSQDEEEREEGQKVLRARIQREEAREYDLAMERKSIEEEKSRRRVSMKVALGNSSAHLDRDVSQGKNARVAEQDNEIPLKKVSQIREGVFAARFASLDFTAKKE